MSKREREDGSLDEKSRLGWILGWVWMAFALLNVIDILRHPWDRSSAYAGSLLLLVSAVVWALWLRPRLRADSQGVLIRNPLRDIELPWGAIEEIDSRDTVRFVTERKQYHSWVGHVPNRRRAAFARTRPRGRFAGLSVDPTGSRQEDAEPGSGKGAAASLAKASDAEFIVTHLNGMADKHRETSREAGHTVATARWSWVAVAVLATPVLLFVVTLLVP